ncbi:hypothetical protein NKI04_34375, partial [Mesorhizobium sp. M0814]|uniref:hypothetical protein n=1 Tax=Mesorhizobium sp. M0814 TaxID=2957004 RepID=UPI00333A4BEC
SAHLLPSQGVHLFWWTPHASEHSTAKGAGKFALTQYALKALNIRPSWSVTLETVCACYASLDRLSEASQCLRQIDQAEGPKRDPIAPMKALNSHWADHMNAMLRKAAAKPD